MRISPSRLVLPGLLALTLAGCSGGGSGGSDIELSCIDGSQFCLVSCDLTCLGGTCGITQVAENQPLRFVFSRRIDPASVTSSSFSIRTATGEAPRGNTIVNQNVIEFVPSISLQGGLATFGFRRNESYIISIAGANTPGQTIRSESGVGLSNDFTCTITATEGILDPDDKPPEGELIAPTNTTEAPLDATIVVRFSEVIDTRPFLAPVGPSTPIQYLLGRPDATTGECPTEGSIQIEGVPEISLEQVDGKNVTVISLKPDVELPGDFCVFVNVTGDVTDLSGKRAIPSQHIFTTEAGQISELTFEETFTTSSRLDEPVSGGVWQNGARPGLLGGDGRHGSFRADLGQPLGNQTFEWSTDSLTIPASNTFSGQPEEVTDGKFYFTDLVLPVGQTVRFVGSNPAQIFVRGRVDIQGTLDVSGAGLTTFRSRNTTNSDIDGQEGGAGGAGGGRGGTGGDRCIGAGPRPDPGFPGFDREDGKPGETVQVDGMHAYLGQVANTGGAGSPLYPAHGVTSQLSTNPDTFTIQFVFNGAINNGGAGGGFSGVGADGTVTFVTGMPILPPPVTDPGQPPLGGVAFNVLPFPAAPPPGYSSLIHFLVGGSGGGGAGSHPFTSLRGAAENWRAGGAGTGGGGALAIRSGNNFVIGASAQLLARGGTGVLIDGDDPNTPTQELVSAPASWGVAAPGGGGSGGSLLLQSSADLQSDGIIDTAGGTGSRTGNILPANLNFESLGGDGANGFYRIEAAGTATVAGGANVPVFDPAQNQGPLNDRDDRSGQRSLWRGAGGVVPPQWLRYELDVDLDNNGTVDVTFSDDPSVPNSSGPATDPNGPVQVWFQGAQISSTTNEPVENTEGPWRQFINENSGPSLNRDDATGFRFLLLFNRAAPGASDPVVTRLTVRARG